MFGRWTEALLAPKALARRSTIPNLNGIVRFTMLRSSRENSGLNEPHYIYIYISLPFFFFVSNGSLQPNSDGLQPNSFMDPELSLDESLSGWEPRTK